MSAFEKVAIGDVHEFGAHVFTAEEMKRFAAAYDPQKFHTDEAAAAKTPFGGLIASGWHTAAVMMRLFVDHFTREIEAARGRGEDAPRFGPSPGFDDLKWLKPVHVGDRVAFTGRVTGKRATKSRPGWGLVTMETTGVNQKGEPVFAFTAHIFAKMAAET